MTSILSIKLVVFKVNADISGQRTIPDTSCIAPKNESTRTHFSIFIIPIRIAIHTRNFKAIRCFVPGLAWQRCQSVRNCALSGNTRIYLIGVQVFKEPVKHKTYCLLIITKLYSL